MPNEPAAETQAQREHLTSTGHRLLYKYLAAEQADGERVIYASEQFASVVP